MDPDHIVSHAVPWQQIMVVCGKCSRKLDGGFGKKGKHALRRVLKSALREAGRRREVRVLETGCFGLCPKHAVTVASSRTPGELLTVPAGMPAEDIIARVVPAPPLDL